MLSDENVDVGADAFVNGNVSGRLRVNGTLHVPPGAQLTGGVEYTTLVNEAITVSPPCDCSAGFVDIAGAIAAAAATNADAAIGLQPTALADVTTPANIVLPCGVFYLATSTPRRPSPWSCRDTRCSRSAATSPRAPASSSSSIRPQSWTCSSADS